MRCASCEKGMAKTARLEIRREVGPHTFTASIRGRKCDTCAEEFYNGEDVGRFEVAIAQALASAGVSSGEAFKFMRKVAELRAIDLAALLGVVPETISRWETNRLPVDRGALALVGLLVADKARGLTTTLEALRAQAEPKRLAKRVELKIAS